MRVFVDTSAVLAALHAGDRRHPEAAQWLTGAGADAALVTSDHVVIEACALIHARLGTAAAVDFVNDWLPAIETHPVDEQVLLRGIAAFRSTLSRTSPSLVDCTSFELMRTLGIRHAFAFDTHFRAAGFELVAGAAWA